MNATLNKLTLRRILLEMKNEDIPLDWAIIDDTNYFFHQQQIEEREYIKSELRDIIELSERDLARDKASDLLNKTARSRATLTSTSPV